MLLSINTFSDATYMKHVKLAISLAATYITVMQATDKWWIF
jgi:hypothetical protein